MSKQRILILLPVFAFAIWLMTRRGEPPAAAARAPAARAPLIQLPAAWMANGGWKRLSHGARDPRWASPRPDGTVRINGTVYEFGTAIGVGPAEVSFDGSSGESSIETDESGHYQVDVPPGIYRVRVRGPGLASIANTATDADRLPGGLYSLAVGAPASDHASAVAVYDDLDALDLPVARTGRVIGKVVDDRGKPVAGAVIRAHGDLRSVSGADSAESAADGSFELEVPVGEYGLAATADGFADYSDWSSVAVHTEVPATTTITLEQGCVIEGKVLAADGSAADSGGIDLAWERDGAFRPVEKFGADGTFRLTMTMSQEVWLRAWPWKSPPTEPQRFVCRPGSHFRRTVFRVKATAADASGTIVDAKGQPVPFAFLDLMHRSGGTGMSQQERADGDGKWGVYAMPPGEYDVIVYAPGVGSVQKRITVPNHNVNIVLDDTGSLAGAVEGMDSGSFVLNLTRCTGSDGHDYRTELAVPVTSGHYQVDGIPACSQLGSIRTPTRTVTESFTINPGDTTLLDLDLTPRRAHEIRGVVRDQAGRAVAAARVTIETAMEGAAGSRTGGTTDTQGRFVVRAFEGDVVWVANDSSSASEMVPETTEVAIDMTIECCAALPEGEELPDEGYEDDGIEIDGLEDEDFEEGSEAEDDPEDLEEG